MNSASKIIVGEYLSSLKEDAELDYLFPILLRMMGFSIISTPKDSKGQSQFGKDIIAIGTSDGRQFKYLFELKGYDDRNINDTVLMKPDGVIESLRAAKYTAYNDSSIPGFDELPIKVVLVHNGVLQRNTQPTFDGFVKREFPVEGEFERWDIHKLTDIFSQYLFGEYLLADEENINLLKRTLVLLEAADYDLSDYKSLVQNLLEGSSEIRSRAFTKKFASLNLVGAILIHYSKETNNLEPAKYGISYLVLQTWAWILENQLEKKKPVLREFRKLLSVHHDLLALYFQKTLPNALLKEGLFAESGGFFESIGYPLRALEYLGYLSYYFRQRYYWPRFEGTINKAEHKRLYDSHNFYLSKVIENNDGCARPLLDIHYIPILHAVLFFLENPNYGEEDEVRANNYIFSVLNNIALVRMRYNRWPELYNNLTSLIEFNATNERPFDYEDSSSILVTVLLELLAIVTDDEIYPNAIEDFRGKEAPNFQVAYINIDETTEAKYFKCNVNEHAYVETDIEFPDTLDEWKKSIASHSPDYEMNRTVAAGFPFLRYLASIYYKNDLPPSCWRKYIKHR